jgi:DNA-binding MarR family transcriptional regulator
MAEITLDRKTFEALAMETRIQILKSLKERRKMQAELAKELGLAASTVSQHLEKMEEAGLVARKHSGKKWIYYDLTEKGREIVSQKKTSVYVFALSVALILMLVGVWSMSVPKPCSACALRASAAPSYDKQMTTGAPVAAGAALPNMTGEITVGDEAESAFIANESAAPVNAGFFEANAVSLVLISLSMVMLVITAFFWKRQK